MSREKLSDGARVLLIGSDARTDKIAGELLKTKGLKIYHISDRDNPGLQRKRHFYVPYQETNADTVARYARDNNMNLAVIGPEAPLQARVQDALRDKGILTVGPSFETAKLSELSKIDFRNFLKRHNIDGQIEYHHIKNLTEAYDVLSSGKEYAIKPDGLTGGKGVKVMGVQLNGREETLDYINQILEDQIGGNRGLLLEERIIGQEFVIQAYVDDSDIKVMPAVADYKHVGEGDTGLLGGGNGSYSRVDGLVKNVSKEQYAQGVKIIHQFINALRKDGYSYQGVLYMQLIVDKDGNVKIIETNNRFGDSDGINAMDRQEEELFPVLYAVAKNKLVDQPVNFKRMANIFQYYVPRGYPNEPRNRSKFWFDEAALAELDVERYFARVSKVGDYYYSTDSRAFGFLAQGNTTVEAREKLDEAAKYVFGELVTRMDIGLGVEG